jgi:uroporphyrinogen-III synthase
VTPKILAFRPEERVAESLRQARELGVELKVLPLIYTARGREAGLEGFLRALSAGEVDYTVFSSPSSFRALKEYAEDAANDLVRRLKKARVVAIGERTASELRDAGLEPSQPAEFSSRGLLEFFRREDLKGRNVFLLRSSEGTDELPEGLSALGARVKDTALYELRPVSDRGVREELREAVLGARFHGYAFTSSMTVRTFFTIFEKEGLLVEALDELRGKLVGAIGGPTAEALLSRGVRSIRPPQACFRELLRVMRDRILAKTL